MNQQEQQIQIVELTIDEARKEVKAGEMAERLSRNPDFKKLILDRYFVDEAARLVHLYGDPNVSDKIREMILRDMAGISSLKQYLSLLVQKGRMAADLIQENQETLEELRIEADDLIVSDNTKSIDEDNE